MKKTIFKLVMTVLALFMISSCAGSDTSSNGSNTQDNDTGSDVVKHVTVWFDAQQSSITNWYQTIESGSVISKPADPVLEGYNFLGWYDSNVNGKLWDFTAPVTTDITLYAAWEQINNGGSDSGNNSGSDNGNEGDNNGGSDSGNGSDSGSKPEVPVICTIQYDNTGIGNTVKSIELQSGTVLYDSHLPALYADGYIFQGWYYNNIKINSGEFKVTENITLTAKWLKEEINDATAPAEVTNLQIYLENNRPVLTWVNPADEDFKTVLITYSKKNSTTTFGGHISSGAGNPDTYTVPKTMTDADQYTFTLQTIDYSGNKSKGINIKLNGSTVEQPEPDPEPVPEPEPEPEPEPDYSAYKNQTKWFYGVEGPLPDSDEWIRPEDTNRVWELIWKEEYGWYDVNKTSSIDKELGKPIAKDANMCWAATASNILHWWFKMNADYIARYDKLNPEKAKTRPSSEYPMAGTKHLGGSEYQESEIFQYFIDHFVDDAGKGDEGFNWFVSGYQIYSPQMSVSGGGGFFEDVFPKGKYLAAYQQGLSKKVFTETIIDAVENHKMLGISAQSGSSHLMTLWGAEFDENGYVSAVYVADNNVIQTSPPYYKNLTRRLIRYDTYPGTTASYTEMSAFGIDKYSTILTLVIVDLGIKYWEEYFQNQESGQ